VAWLLQSPPLLSLAPQRFSAAVQSFDAAQSSLITAWLEALDTQALHDAVAQALPSKAPMRLGRYAEQLMAYFLRHSSLFDLIAANVPLRRTIHAADSPREQQHTTVGEFDYLLRDHADQPWHWEMAVKFYLCHLPQGSTTANSTIANSTTADNNAQPQDFKGPAGKDTLGLKLGKVFDKQLRHLAPPPYDTVDWQPAAYARGWLFYPFGAAPAQCDALNPAHLRGWWLGIAAFEATDFGCAHFVHLPRLHWLAPYALDELPVLSQADMARHLHAFWRDADPRHAAAAQMIACVTPASAGSGGCAHGAAPWREMSRGYVKPVA
jgi:uncharacterized protein